MRDAHVPPDVSVVITAFNERHAIERCLTSLARQQTSHTFEVILIDSSTDGTDAAARRFSFVQVRHFAERRYCGDARNEGVALARADLIAFLDADCFVASDWVEQIVRAHRTPHLAVGGVIENGTPESLVAWAYYFCEFNLWLPRESEVSVPQMAGCALSVKRGAFDRYGPFLTGTYCSDSVFHWRMANDGHRVLSVPTIRVFHTVRYRVGEFLRHVVEHRRCYARVIARQNGFSARQRVVAALTTAVLPLLLLPVIAWRVARSSVPIRHFLFSAPLVLLGVIARAWGEFLGYVRVGAGATGRPQASPA